jgi:hypothetical protein
MGCPTNHNTFALSISETHKQIISMKKVALVISLFTLIFAFTVSTASAQKVTSASKASTEKVSTSKDAPAKSCCTKSDSKTSAACAKEGEAKSSGCSKSCSKAEMKNCNKGEAKTETAPVPKKN